MMFEQRVPPGPDHFEPVAAWVSPHLAEVMPSVPHRGATFETPGVPDFYVVIDEMDERCCRLTVDRWPDTDEDGRLVFDDEATLLRTVDATVLHDFVTDARQGTEQLAPERPLRIGDVFAVWWGQFADAVLDLRPPGTHGDAADVDPSGAAIELLDITADAREITNAAAQAAACPVLTTDDLDRLDLNRPDSEADS